jgi:hypothetical protein
MSLGSGSALARVSEAFLLSRSERRRGRKGAMPMVNAAGAVYVRNLFPKIETCASLARSSNMGGRVFGGRPRAEEAGERKSFRFGQIKLSKSKHLYLNLRLGLAGRDLGLLLKPGAARANASCESRQALEKAQNGNGEVLSKVGMDLGLAPRRLGIGATSVWGWRRRRCAASLAAGEKGPYQPSTL